MVTPFGVSGILYFVNFLLVPDHSDHWAVRWRGPAVAVSFAALVWGGGLLLASAIPAEPLAFSAMLVQPHERLIDGARWRPWLQLDPLTQSSLQRQGPVDLIVWPETCLSDSIDADTTSDSKPVSPQMTVQDFSRTLLPIYRTNCLVGVSMSKLETVHRYGFDLKVARRYNCGCLVSGSGQRLYHEKQVLVPLKESVPDWMNQAWILSRMPHALRLNAPFTPGGQFRVLPFQDSRGERRTIAVSVCYESFFPWLPQYHTVEPVDAIIHILYDGHSIDHPSLLRRQINACRYRAIETRTWNLVCSTWAGTAIIDPAGRVICQLPATAGVLRSDDLGSSKVARLSGGSLP